jgi:hypothetical protein
MPRTAATARVTTRPDPSQWQDDELMTLGEAAALFCPDGPFSERTLRTAAASDLAGGGQIPAPSRSAGAAALRTIWRQSGACAKAKLCGSAG